MRVIQFDLAPGILHAEPGWLGHFTRAQAPEACFANGSRITKVAQEAGDATELGTSGTVLGSLKIPEIPYCGYFVEWDNRPRYAVFVVEWKIASL